MRKISENHRASVVAILLSGWEMQTIFPRCCWHLFN